MSYAPDGLPFAANELEAQQLELVGETQTPEEIETIIAMAGPDQWVQTYSDGETLETLAAVLVDTPPTPGEFLDELIPLDGESSPVNEIQPFAVQYCDPKK